MDASYQYKFVSSVQGHGEVEEGDDEFEVYRKRMMLGYKHRPNPLGGLLACSHQINCAQAKPSAFLMLMTDLLLPVQATHGSHTTDSEGCYPRLMLHLAMLQTCFWLFAGAVGFTRLLIQLWAEVDCLYGGPVPPITQHVEQLAHRR